MAEDKIVIACGDLYACSDHLTQEMGFLQYKRAH
jgi:hypothetical protein